MKPILGANVKRLLNKSSNEYKPQTSALEDALPKVGNTLKSTAINKVLPNVDNSKYTPEAKPVLSTTLHKTTSSTFKLPDYKPPEQTQAKLIKDNVTNLAKENFGELNSRGVFDDIDEDTINKNIPLAEETVRKNTLNGFYNKLPVEKLPNLKNGLTMFYAADEKGNKKAANMAQKLAYIEKPSTTTQETIKDILNSNNKLTPSWKTPKESKPVGGTRYVDASSLNIRSAPGTSSSVIASLPDKSQVHFTGNKTPEPLDNHYWAEIISKDNKQGWVAADYLRLEPKKETASAKSNNTNNSFDIPVSNTTPKPTVNTPAKPKSNIDWRDGKALQIAFNDVGDYDGVEGLQCPDIVKWFLNEFTTLTPQSGNGCKQVGNIAAANGGLKISTEPCAPAVFSVKGGTYGPGIEDGRVSDNTAGHTGIVLSCEKIDNNNYKIKYFHTYNALKNDDYNSSIATKTFTKEQLKNTTFLDLSPFIKE